MAKEFTYRDENGNLFFGYDEEDLQENIKLGLVYTCCHGPGWSCGLPMLGKVTEEYSYCEECEDNNRKDQAK